MARFGFDISLHKYTFKSLAICNLRCLYFIFQSYTRIFSYIDSSGINIEGASNRGWFYEYALNLFYENMLFGHGIFRYTIKAGAFYAHNIFLDID